MILSINFAIDVCRSAKYILSTYSNAWHTVSAHKTVTITGCVFFSFFPPRVSPQLFQPQPLSRQTWQLARG